MKKRELEAKILQMQKTQEEFDILSEARINDLTLQRDEYYKALQEQSKWNEKNIAGKVILGNMRYNYLSKLEDVVLKFCDDFDSWRNQEILPASVNSQSEMNQPLQSLLNSHHKNCECGCKYKQGPTE